MDRVDITKIYAGYILAKLAEPLDMFRHSFNVILRDFIYSNDGLCCLWSLEDRNIFDTAVWHNRSVGITKL